MGIFDLLSKEGRKKGALERHIKKTADKFAQSEDRFAAMEKLREDGSDEALYGLCRRFSFVYDKTIQDETEKQWVADTLAGFGERAIPAVRKFILAAETVSHSLSVLDRVAPADTMLAIIDELAAREEPGYTRDPDKKIQFLTFLGEYHKAPPGETARRIVPYLGDFDEGVRFAAVEALAHQTEDPKLEEVARLPLLQAIVRPAEESRRIKVRIGELLAQVGWRVTEEKEAVQKLLGGDVPEFAMQHDKLVKKGK
ncbi:MAG TPA: hypothetical protein VKE22_14080 [Haliangiales bacterium]|nr:hypothetical protein [Haliangiales bacterium]